MRSLAYLLVNFGGPRSLREIEPFLCELLTDKDVVRTKWPQIVHNFLFRRIAKKRAKKIREDYVSIGGKSPIYSDTEWIASTLEEKLNAPVFTFHRYLPSTHRGSIEALESAEFEELRVFPMFPQFTFATTGSIARFFTQNLSHKTLSKLKWIKSYPSHPVFVRLYQKMIKEFMEKKGLAEENVFLIFSAHGLPHSFVEEGDPYENECRSSFSRVMEAFSKIEAVLSFQSKFGPGEWLRPYTQDVCENIENHAKQRKDVVFVPISFTSDHIETLFEMEKLYLPIVMNKGYRGHRLPAMNRRLDWVEAIEEILKDSRAVSTKNLIRIN